MEGSHIYEGDLVYVQKCNTIASGQIGIVIIGDEATIKRLYYKDNLIILEASNPKYGSHFFTKQEIEEIPVQVIGLVRFLKRECKINCVS